MEAFVTSNCILAITKNTSNIAHMKQMKNEILDIFRFLLVVGQEDFGQKQVAIIADTIASLEILSRHVQLADVNLLQTPKWNLIFPLNLPIKILGTMSVWLMGTRYP